MLLKLPLELRDEVYKYLNFFDVLKLYDADEKLIEHFEPDKFIKLYWEIKCKNHEGYDINLIKNELLEIMNGDGLLFYNFKVPVRSGVYIEEYAEVPFKCSCSSCKFKLNKNTVLYRFLEVLDMLYCPGYSNVSSTLPFFCDVCDKVIHWNTKKILHKDTKAHNAKLNRICNGGWKRTKQFDIYFFFKCYELLNNDLFC